MTILKHILSSSLENAARYLQHVKDSHTLFAFKLRPNIKTITGLWVWRYTFLTAKLQIYTRAQKIVVPLQMLCAWSAHCFVCQPTTNYHAPPGLRFSLPLQIYLPRKRLLLRKRRSCLCRGFLSRNYYVLVIFCEHTQNGPLHIVWKFYDSQTAKMFVPRPLFNMFSRPPVVSRLVAHCQSGTY